MLTKDRDANLRELRRLHFHEVQCALLACWAGKNDRAQACLETARKYQRMAADLGGNVS